MAGETSFNLTIFDMTGASAQVSVLGYNSIGGLLDERVVYKAPNGWSERFARGYNSIGDLLDEQVIHKASNASSGRSLSKYIGMSSSGNAPLYGP